MYKHWQHWADTEPTREQALAWLARRDGLTVPDERTDPEGYQRLKQRYVYHPDEDSQPVWLTVMAWPVWFARYVAVLAGYHGIPTDGTAGAAWAELVDYAVHAVRNTTRYEQDPTAKQIAVAAYEVAARLQVFMSMDRVPAPPVGIALRPRPASYYFDHMDRVRKRTHPGPT